MVTMCTALAQWFRGDGAASAEQVAAQYVDFALDLVRCADPPYDRTICVGRSPSGGGSAPLRFRLPHRWTVVMTPQRPPRARSSPASRWPVRVRPLFSP